MTTDIQDLASPNFQEMVELWLQIMDRPSDVAMAINFGVKLVKLACPREFVALAFRNGLEDHDSDLRRLNGDGLSSIV